MLTVILHTKRKREVTKTKCINNKKTKHSDPNERKLKIGRSTAETLQEPFLTLE